MVFARIYTYPVANMSSELAAQSIMSHKKSWNCPTLYLEISGEFVADFAGVSDGRRACIVWEGGGSVGEVTWGVVPRVSVPLGSVLPR